MRGSPQSDGSPFSLPANARRRAVRPDAARRRRQIEIRRHIVVGQAFEDHLLERVDRICQPPRHARVQRTAILGQSTDQREDLRAHLRLPGLGLRLGPNRRNRCVPAIELLLRDPVHPLQQRIVNLGLRAEPRRCEQGYRHQSHPCSIYVAQVPDLRS